MRLITKTACPFAQRTRIVLSLLDLPHELVLVDVYDKPDWFKALSPLGKVPVLEDGDDALFESTAINEYLVECYGAEQAMIPHTPAERARMRAWIQFDETAMTPAFYRLLLAQTKPAQETCRQTYEDRLGVLEDRLVRTETPYLMGEALTLADVTLYTHLTRLPLLVRERSVRPRAAEAPLMRWMARLEEDPRILAAAPSSSELEEDLAPYLSATVQGDTAKDIGHG